MMAQQLSASGWKKRKANRIVIVGWREERQSSGMASENTYRVETGRHVGRKESCLRQKHQFAREILC